MKGYYGSLSLLSRLLLASIFLISGLTKIPNWQETLQYMNAQGLPASSILLAIATVIEIACGLSILFGFRARRGAGILFLYLIPVTLTFHGFWAYSGMDYQMQTIQFLKNITIMGGLLQVVIHGPGRVSMDVRRGYELESPVRDTATGRAA